jgi:hypothetical protein
MRLSAVASAKKFTAIKDKTELIKKARFCRLCKV